ncbi:hypothetical protein GPECTOR_42g825 [Gonium pectorale]|uniref:FAD-binding FR-type domain-containing protein n=1 Tax=Gonium pectorale TaxID=33097 RepID=A0A150G9U3_GONPE|nr:hypothetical protein GPECTOR_42g825 [Gonium pectorale]|eukprot:KXZ46614.1 hypothetical protein GPECTOR_42g825 [Gonium pectorale]
MLQVASTVRRVMAYRVPPRGLWRALLGPSGLSLLDLFLILLWWALHAMWMYEMVMVVVDIRRMNPPPPPPPAFVARKLRASLPGTSYAHRQLLQQLPSLPDYVKEYTAKLFGYIGRMDLLLLFFPLARCNFLHWLLGSDFPTLVKYHKWLGYGTILMYSLHGIMYLGIWSHEGVLSQMLNWGMDGYPIVYPGAGVNRLAGLIALIAGWVLLLGTIPAIRRRFFALWHASHVLAAVVFLLFAAMHRKDVAPWMMPGMFLYLLDVVLRTIQQNFNSTAVSVAPDSTSGASYAVVSRDGRLLSLTLQCKEDLRFSGSDIVFLNAPSISWWQWHPFTVASSSASGSIVLHIKKHSGWTKVTPALGMLSEMVAEQTRQRQEGHANGDAETRNNPRVTLIWVSRSADEFSALPDEILHEANRGKAGWLDLQLYNTDSAARGHRGAGGDDLADSKAVVLDVNRPPASGSSAAEESARPLSHPYMFHPLLWAAAVILSFVGGFGGVMAFQEYDARKARTVLYRTDFSYVGLLQWATLGFGCTVGPAVLFLTAHTWRYLSLRRWRGTVSESTAAAVPHASAAAVAPRGRPAAHSATTLGASPKSSASHSGIAAFLKAGRPNVAAILEGIADGDYDHDYAGAAGTLQAGRGVGVFVGGPPALVAAVDEACAALNGVWGRAGRAYLEPHIMTQEL